MGPVEVTAAALQPPENPSPAQVQQQLDRILASALCVRSGRIARFLRFAVEQALHSADTKEYLVGVEVFDRPPSYDPRIDPIVRVEARRLRAKLKDYYGSAGAADPVIIELPKGAY